MTVSLSHVTKQYGKQYAVRDVSFEVAPVRVASIEGMVAADVPNLASVALNQYRNSVLQAKEAALRSNLFHMREAIDQYYADKGKYPSSIDTLVSDGPIPSERTLSAERAAAVRAVRAGSLDRIPIPESPLDIPCHDQPELFPSVVDSGNFNVW